LPTNNEGCFWIDEKLYDVKFIFQTRVKGFLFRLG
jgi:hypothetical protein